MWYQMFQKMEEYIHPLQKKGMSNERARQEKPFKHIFRGRDEGKITKQ